MDHKVVWSPEALEDVESIAGYIAKDSAFYAAAVVQKILDTSRDLSRFPLVGRIVSELEDESIRERFVYSYRLIYRMRDDVITVAAVIHGRRLLNPVTERIKGP